MIQEEKPERKAYREDLNEWLERSALVLEEYAEKYEKSNENSVDTDRDVQD